jgi:hypothetical protein
LFPSAPAFDISATAYICGHRRAKNERKKKTIAAANFLHLLNDNPSIPIFDTENICSHNMVDIEPLTKRTRSVQQL